MTTLEYTIFIFIYWLSGFIPVLLAYKVIRMINEPKADVEARKVTVNELGWSFLFGWFSGLAVGIALIIVILHIQIPEQYFKKCDNWLMKLKMFGQRKLF